MSLHARSEVESGAAASVRSDPREESGPVVTVAEAHVRSDETARAVERIAAFTADELAAVRAPHPSGAFAKQADGAEPLDWKALAPASALPPMAAGPSDRAVLHVADLGVDVANPFFGSSLLPPPRKRRPWLARLGLALGAGALLATGYAVAYRQIGLERGGAAELAPAAEAVIAMAAPQVEVAVPKVEPLAIETEHEVAATTTDPAPAAKATRAARPRRARAGRPQGRRARPSPAFASNAGNVRKAAGGVMRKVARVETVAITRGEPLTRAEVKAGIEGVRGAMTTCAAGRSGEILADLTISGAGHVAHATIRGAFAGTPQGSCMARALRAAEFPATTSGLLRVRYPFVF